MFSAAHDLSDGGLAQSIVESCLRGGNGARLCCRRRTRTGPLDPFVALFSESAGRAVVASRGPRSCGHRTCGKARHAACRADRVVDGDVLEVQGHFTVPLTELRAAHTATFPPLFGTEPSGCDVIGVM